MRPLPARPIGRASKVCVSGGIGSGKSALTEALARLGAVRFDADEVLRQATGVGGVALPALREAFGSGVFASDGVLDRAALARVVFADASAKARLESILHPLVWEEMDRVVAGLTLAETLIAEIPLITETGNHGRFDVVIMVDAPVETRVERLAKRGMTEADARARIGAQATREERESIAHLWVENTGSPADLEDVARELWEILQSWDDGGVLCRPTMINPMSEKPLLPRDLVENPIL